MSNYYIIRKEYVTRRPNRNVLGSNFQDFKTIKWDIYDDGRWVATYNFKREAVKRLNRLNNA